MSLNSPSVDKLIRIIGGNTKFYCSVDLRHGYQDITMNPSDGKKDFFSTKGQARKLQYHVLLYRFIYRGQVCQCAMAKILSGLIKVCCHVYVEDILFFGENTKQTIKNHDVLLVLITAEGLKINFGK
jgi:hypothetical protein